eukprot:CAMPEP_0196253986 /NCGR_PEP_ID=MMETSP0913-20130531/52891_1 /TAXON_ID=49265 /ORGANISM="Thalassiosira rotula, Strain GSO102" /LENGTH=179 /DNA_ID=CAMNT_0041541125 /DNA_START=91 /DNA_END=627 /DNA_ORIENTATION=+
MKLQLLLSATVVMLSASSGKALNENSKIYDIADNSEDITQYSSSDALYTPFGSEDIPDDSKDVALDSSPRDVPFLRGATSQSDRCQAITKRRECTVGTAWGSTRDDCWYNPTTKMCERWDRHTNRCPSFKRRRCKNLPEECEWVKENDRCESLFWDRNRCPSFDNKRDCEWFPEDECLW